MAGNCVGTFVEPGPDAITLGRQEISPKKIDNVARAIERLVKVTAKKPEGALVKA